ncbi:MAG TPA: hypothetical protein VMS08_02615 [Candidatus Saccharimonadia bacterium]|nr:hypothetical protein [Candidatus Saccharimonadia bacterium]
MAEPLANNSDRDKIFSSAEAARHLAGPEAEREHVLEPINGDRPLRDFQQTFLVSNGLVQAQDMIMAALANSYVTTTNPEQFDEAIPVRQRPYPLVRDPPQSQAHF